MQKFELTEQMLKLLNEHGARLKTMGESQLFMAIDVILARAPASSPAGTYVRLEKGDEHYEQARSDHRWITAESYERYKRAPRCKCGRLCETLMTSANGNRYSLFDGRCDACEEERNKQKHAYLAKREVAANDSS